MSKVVPAQLGFLAIYNPSLGTTDDTLDQQIVYYQSTESRAEADRLRGHLDGDAFQNAMREQNNEQLRQIGFAQGMVEFGKSFSEGRSVDTIETVKSRIILHELEAGWWILASINLTILPGPPKPILNKGKTAEEHETTEYSSREVKPAILLLGDLLKAHATFLLHHASSLSALFVRTRRPKFIGILGRYWDTYLSTWNVLMHGNPANSLYGGIKVAACGELGMGVGEEERGSGEREVLEGFVGRIEGLVDVIVSKFGDGEASHESDAKAMAKMTEPWLGSGNEPAAEDGVVFLGTGALSRKSLRDVSHWVEDLYRWGPHAYGVVDNPTSNRRTRKSKAKGKSQTRSPAAKEASRQVYGTSLRNRASNLDAPTLTKISPTPVEEGPPESSNKYLRRRPTFQRGEGSFGSTESESGKSNTFMNYLKLGYGKHWSLGGSTSKSESTGGPEHREVSNSSLPPRFINDDASESVMYPPDDSVGHYLIGLLGDVENESENEAGKDAFSQTGKRPALEHRSSSASDNARLLLRTLTVELEREEDARAEADISIDLGNVDTDRASSLNPGSEHTGTSANSFESQDRNKTKKLRVVVYVKKPFIFVLFFELRAHVLAMTSLYRSLHYQIGPLINPLLNSTSYRAVKPEFTTVGLEYSSAPIFDLLWDPKLLTVNSTIPNIPDPHQTHTAHFTWSRVEALNTHMQIINTYISTTSDQSEMERTCKTSRGWWVVWTKLPALEPPAPGTSLKFGKFQIPQLIAEDSVDNATLATLSTLSPWKGASRGTSTFQASVNSGPAHPFLDSTTNVHEYTHLEKQVFLIRRAGDHAASRGYPGRSASAVDAAGPGKLAHGIGVDTKRYIEGLLNLNR